jgi:exodeoxyribonuclease-3
MVRIATWNVNSVRQRLDALQDFLKKEDIDVCCLQEIKCIEDQFPRDILESQGYHVIVCGQKSYNGVALLSRISIASLEEKFLPGDPQDTQARYLEVLLSSPQQRLMRVICLYAPNGNPIGTEKFSYKLAWMNRLHEHLKILLTYEEPLIIAGDYNIIPEPCDAANPQQWVDDALFQPESRAHFRSLKNLGLIDAVRICTSDPAYTFWGYRGQSWKKNNGIRIDHFLLSPQAADHLKSAYVNTSLRNMDNASDHVPVRIDLDL